MGSFLRKTATGASCDGSEHGSAIRLDSAECATSDESERETLWFLAFRGDALHFGWDRAAGSLKQYIAVLDSSR
jgi:hypothetical protein